MKFFDRWVYLIFLLCGILTALPFISEALWFIAWLSVAPVIYYMLRCGNKIRLRRAYGLGVTFGIGYFGVMYHWFSYLYPMEFAGLSKGESVAVVAVCWIGLALIQSLEFGCVTALYRLIRPSAARPWLGALTFTALWTVYEWQQTLAWRGVPWGRLALSQSAVLPFLQSASLFGSMFVSGLIVAVNAFIAAAKYEHDRKASPTPQAVNKSSIGAAAPENSDSDGVTEPESSLSDGTVISAKSTPVESSDAVVSHPVRRPSYIFKKLTSFARSCVHSFAREKAVRLYAVIAAVLFASNALFGVIRMSIHDEKQGEPLVAAVIQGNISSLEKWSVTALEAAKDHVALTRECVESTGAKLVVWAETAIPVTLDNNPTIKALIQNTADELDITLVVGVFTNEYNTETGETDKYNSLVLFGPDGSEYETRYFKRRLVPFGESLPMEGFIRTFLPILLEMNILSDPLAEGTETNIFKTELGNIGGLICFDSIYQQLTLDSVRDGAELLVLSTNDSWFYDSAAVHQHNHHATLRAIESARYIVRSANTGISSVIDSEGRILSELPALVRGQTAATVYFSTERTLYSYIGDTYAYLCIAFAGVSLAHSAWTALKARRKRHPSTEQ